MIEMQVGKALKYRLYLASITTAYTIKLPLCNKVSFNTYVNNFEKIFFIALQMANKNFLKTDSVFPEDLHFKSDVNPCRHG